MKLIIALFLILTLGQSHAVLGSDPIFHSGPSRILSQVCGNDFVYGRRHELSNGQYIFMCLYIEKLPDFYEADILKPCYNTHTETIRLFSNNDFHSKECVLTEQLGHTYYTDISNECIYGYESDDEVTYRDVKFSHKTCVAI